MNRKYIANEKQRRKGSAVNLKMYLKNRLKERCKKVAIEKKRCYQSVYKDVIEDKESRFESYDWRSIEISFERRCHRRSI